MKRPLKYLAALCLALALMFSLASMAFAGPNDFLLINQTGLTITHIYISPTGTNSWGSDILAGNSIGNNTMSDVKFTSGPNSNWDIQVQDNNGNALTFTNINLFLTNTLFIFADGSFFLS